MGSRAPHRHHRRARAVALGAVLALALTACSAGPAADPTTSTSAPEAAAASDSVAPFVHRPVDREAPSFTLLDTESRPVGLDDFEGKWVLVDWVFTNCVDFCPLLTGDMSNAYRLLGDAMGDRVEFVTISFDPTRDSPEQMAAYAAQVGGLKEGWTWLTGTQDETDAVAASYGVSFTEADDVDGVGQFDHTALMVVIGPDGRERHRYLGTGWSEDVVERLEPVLEAGTDESPDATTTTTIAVQALDSDDLTAAVDSEIMDSAIVLPWEDFELEDGVTSQVLYQFPNTGYRATFVDTLLEPARERGDEPRRIVLSAMNVHQVPLVDGGWFGVADSQNLAVVIEGEDWHSIFYAFTLLDSEWCCGTP